ncbi:MAG: hypothetical protein WCR52_06190 [Bacteroidota bacterium]
MNYLYFFGIALLAEIVLAFIFAVIAQVFYKKQGLDFRSIFKGIIERAFLVIALVHDFPHALTFFSALKLGTRLKHKDLDNASENAFNDFYLIGNLVSVAVAIGYVLLFKFLIPK